MILKCKSANLTIYRIAFYSNMAWLKWHIKIDLVAAYDLKSLLKESHRINSIKLIIGEEWIDSIHSTIQINFFFKRKISKLNKINNWITAEYLKSMILQIRKWRLVFQLGSKLLQVGSKMRDLTWSNSDPCYKPGSIFETVIYSVF